MDIEALGRRLPVELAAVEDVPGGGDSFTRRLLGDGDDAGGLVAALGSAALLVKEVQHEGAAIGLLRVGGGGIIATKETASSV